MTRTITATALGLALGGLLLVGCGTTSPASSANSTGALTTTASTTAPSGPTAAADTTVEGIRWRLVSYQQRTASVVVAGDAAAGTEPIMIISDGRIRFDGLCNGPNGEIAVRGMTLAVAGLDRTEMACADGRGEMEKLVLDTFVGTVGYTLSDDTLTVTGADTTLTFVPITEGGGVPEPTTGPTPSAEEGTDLPTDDTTPLDGTWLLTGYTDSTGDHPVPDSVQPTMTVGAGRIGIDAQCNSVGGTLVVGDTTLAVTEVLGTMMFCDDARGEMETLLTGTLKVTVDFTVADGVLTVTGPTATLVFRAS